MESYPREKLLVRLGGPSLSPSDVQAITTHSPHGAELMKWLSEALESEAEETDLLLQKYALEEEEINM